MTMMTTAQAARALGRSPRSILDAIRRGSLPATRHGRDWMLDPEHVITYGTESRGGAGRKRDPQSRRLHVVGLDPAMGARIRRQARHLGLTLPAYLTALERLREVTQAMADRGTVEDQERLQALGLTRDVEPGWERFVELHGQGLEAYNTEGR